MYGSLVSDEWRARSGGHGVAPKSSGGGGVDPGEADQEGPSRRVHRRPDPHDPPRVRLRRGTRGRHLRLAPRHRRCDAPRHRRGQAEREARPGGSLRHRRPHRRALEHHTRWPLRAARRHRHRRAERPAASHRRLRAPQGRERCDRGRHRGRPPHRLSRALNRRARHRRGGARSSRHARHRHRDHHP